MTLRGMPAGAIQILIIVVLHKLEFWRLSLV
jgi:hypothetical protein